MGKPGYVIIFGGIFVVVGLAATFLLGQGRTLVCYRTESDQIDCRLESHFLGIGLGETEIRQLQSAGVETSGNTYRVMLFSKSGNVPLTGYHSSGRDSKQETADRMNAFIANPSQPSLEIRQTDLFGFLFGGIFVFVGLSAMFGKRGRRAVAFLVAAVVVAVVVMVAAEGVVAVAAEVAVVMVTKQPFAGVKYGHSFTFNLAPEIQDNADFRGLPLLKGDLNFPSRHLIKSRRDLNTNHSRLVSNVFSYNLPSNISFLVLAGRRIKGADEDVRIQKNVISHESRSWFKSSFGSWPCSAGKKLEFSLLTAGATRALSAGSGWGRVLNYHCFL